MSTFSIEPRRSAPSHTILICVAICLSLVVHLVMLIVMERIPLHNISTDVEKARQRLAEAHDKYPPLQVDRLVEDPLRPLDPPPADQPLHSTDMTRDAIADWIRAAIPMPDTPVAPSPAPDIPPPNPTLVVPAPEPAKTSPVFARQEIAQILDRKINEALAVTPRRELTDIPRETHAKLDFAPPGLPALEPPKGLAPSASSLISEHIAAILPSADFAAPSLHSAQPQVASVTTYVAPVLEFPAPTKFTALDDRLSAGIQVFNAPDGSLYFRIALKPQKPDVLPVEPRDVLFVQDCSTSLSESRLQFCKRALDDALNTLAPDDRFNVMAFKDTTTTAFTAWQKPDPSNLDRARKFISQMSASGSTDFFAALQKVLDLPRIDGRPLIVLLITDGQPTIGMTGSTQIIGEFTRLNSGQISLFAFGTHSVANTYLLDLLTHSNRGAVQIAKGTRWDLPKTIAPFVDTIKAPLMHAMQAQFTGSSGSEVYPSELPNLFAGRTLDLYGRCPAGTREVVMQLRGKTSASAYDAIFRLDLSDAESGSPSLRERWAQLKMYDLIARYARSPDPALFQSLRQLSDGYNVPMFYEHDISP